VAVLSAFLSHGYRNGLVYLLYDLSVSGSLGQRVTASDNLSLTHSNSILVTSTKVNGYSSHHNVDISAIFLRHIESTTDIYTYVVNHKMFGYGHTKKHTFFHSLRLTLCEKLLKRSPLLWECFPVLFRWRTTKFIPRETPVYGIIYWPENKDAIGSGRRLVHYCQLLD